MKEQELYQSNSGEFYAPALDACKCCGGDSEIIFTGNEHTKSRKVTIKCTKCRLQRTDAAIRQSHELIARKCIELWNTRPEQPELSDEQINNVLSRIYDENTAEIIFLDDDIHSMVYKQYNKDGEIIRAGDILYPDKAGNK